MNISAGQGSAWRGRAGQGKARHGSARRGQARQGKFRITATILILLIALLSCALPGTNSEYQLSSEIQKSVHDNYVGIGVTEYVTPIPTPISTLTPTNEIIIIQSSKTPEHEIILLQNFFVYIIQEGDSFALLARRFCSDERKYKWLLQVNGMEEGEILEVGREVIISCTEEDNR